VTVKRSGKTVALNEARQMTEDSNSENMDSVYFNTSGSKPEIANPVAKTDSNFKKNPDQSKFSCELFFDEDMKSLQKDIFSRRVFFEPEHHTEKKEKNSEDMANKIEVLKKSTPTPNMPHSSPILAAYEQDKKDAKKEAEDASKNTQQLEIREIATGMFAGQQIK
jgi:hypothetical protein